MVSSKPLFSFVHVTDTHYHRDNAMLKTFVDTINRETAFPLPDYVIHTGDIIRGYNKTLEEHYEQMREARAILDGLKVLALFTCHNHDTYGEDVRGKVFDEVFGAPHLQEIHRDGFYLLILSGALTSSDIWGSVPEGELAPQWGFDFHTPEGLEVLRTRLGIHPAVNKLVFSHAGLVTPRQEPIAVDATSPIRSRAGFGYCMSESKAAPIRKILREHGVVAHYSGHCHINSRHQLGGVHYISTSSLQHFPGEVRPVSVFQNCLEHKMVSLSNGKNLPFRWSNVRDADHAITELYFLGNEDERDFTIWIE